MSTPTLAELAAPVLLMAEAFTSHMVHLHTDTTENVAALVAFKRALKEAEAPKPCQCSECRPWHALDNPAPPPTAQDALIAEALSERTEKMISHLRFQKEKNPNSVTWEGECVLELADALTTEPYRHALEQRLIGSNLPGLTGDADADLMRFVLHEQEIAGYFCGQLEKDLTAERAARVAAEKASIGCLSERDLWCREARAAYDRRDAAIARAERAEASEKRFSDEVSAAFRKHGLAAGPNAIDGLVRDLDTLRELNQVNEKLERELAGLGPVEWEYDDNGWMAADTEDWARYSVTQLHASKGVRAIRRVLPAKEASE